MKPTKFSFLYSPEGDEYVKEFISNKGNIFDAIQDFLSIILSWEKDIDSEAMITLSDGTYEFKPLDVRSDFFGQLYVVYEDKEIYTNAIKNCAEPQL